MKSDNFNIKSIEVKAETRALRSKWTQELANDLSYSSSIDIDQFERTIFEEFRRLERNKNRKNSINKIFS